MTCVAAPRHSSTKRHRMRGASMVEMAFAALALITIGLVIVQYGMLYFAKNNVNYAIFEAARAGAMAHAQVTQIEDRFARALVGLYGGGTTPVELAASFAKAKADLSANSRVEILNPVRESFEWNDPRLQTLIGGRFPSVAGGTPRVIPNTALNLRSNAGSVRPASSQNLYDANVLKLRITFGYQPRIPIANRLMVAAWSAAHGFSPPSDPYQQTLIANGRIPIVAQATVRMESEPVENLAMAWRTGAPSAGGGGGGGSTGGTPPAGTGPTAPLPGTPSTGTPPSGTPSPGTPPLPDPCSGGACNPPTQSPGLCLPGDSSCRPPGCSSGDPACDPVCQAMCCVAPTGSVIPGLVIRP